MDTAGSFIPAQNRCGRISTEFFCATTYQVTINSPEHKYICTRRYLPAPNILTSCLKNKVYVQLSRNYGTTSYLKILRLSDSCSKITYFRPFLVSVGTSNDELMLYSTYDELGLYFREMYAKTPNVKLSQLDMPSEFALWLY